jgi:hypothetical protein
MSFLESKHLFNKMCRSSHVGSAVVGIFLQEDKSILEEVGGPQAPCKEDPNFSLEKGNPSCI